MNLERVDEIFARASALEANEREQYLDEACEGDAELRQEVQTLLDAQEAQGQFMGEPSRVSATETVTTPGALERKGQMIGRYKLLQQIGQGGFGTVWMADQREPVKRRVALKIIKLGMDTEQVIARFEAERQALAMLDHPNIAKVLDAGSTETGRPYFVMEYIRGDPILEYCDRETMDTKDRLELFIQVCNAIQHAHQKGIIHRDIKPTNILVTLHDGEPVPKVIDFGIAKATSSELTTKTLFTEHRQFVGTPAYMSPEQAEMSGLDIDTRTDVYSLGVLLYELLTGSTPFGNEELLSKGFVEMMRIIRDIDPPKPSTRLSESQDTIASVAANRRAEPRKLNTIIRGELDWIVMKALEKNRNRRYESASRFAEDIRQFLAGESVEAAPASRIYKLRKVVRRNKGAVFAGVLVALALLAGVIAFAWQARVADIERGKALADRNAAVEAQALADERAEDLELVASFQERMLQRIRAWAAGERLSKDVMERYRATLERLGMPEAQRESMIVAFQEQWKHVNAADVAIELIDTQILQPAAELIDGQFGRQPVIDARLRQRLAVIYRNLGLLEQAKPLQERALELRRQELGPDHPDTLDSIANTAGLFERLGRRADTLVLREEVLEGRRRALGPEHPDTIRATDAMAFALRTLGRFAESERFYRELVRLRRKVFGDGHPTTIGSLVSFAELLRDMGRLSEAEPLFREALVGRRRLLGDDHTNTVLVMAWHGAVLRDLGRTAEADLVLGEALERYARGVAEARAGVRPNWQPAGGLSDRLASMYVRWGDYPQAERFFRDAIDRKLQTYGEENQFTISAICRLADVLIKQDELGEGETRAIDGLTKAQRALGNEDETTRYAIRVMGELLMAQGKPAQAEQYFVRALDLERRLRHQDHPYTVIALTRLAQSRHALEQLREARAGFEEAITMQRRLTPEGSSSLARVLHASGSSRLVSGEPLAALAELQEAADLGERLLPPGHPELSEYRRTLSACQDLVADG